MTAPAAPVADPAVRHLTGAMSRSQMRSVALPSLLANWVLLAALFAVGVLYASGGSSARDLLISDLLINLVLVLGFHIFIGNTGVLSFGHLGIASVAAYTMALLAVPSERKIVLIPNAPWGIPEIELSPLVASLIGVGVGVVVAALLGFVAARTSGLAATMITLAFLAIVRQVAENRKDLTGGAQNLSSVPRLDGWSWPLLGAFLAVMIAVFFRSSKTGRLAVATREDELAAGAMGIEVFTPRLVAFVVSGGLVAFGGILRVQSLGSIGPSQFSFEFTILILAMLVVGGMRTVTGAIAGTVFITVGKEVTRYLGDGPDLLGISLPVVDGLPDLFLAGSLLAVLLTRPNGLLGEFDVGSWLTRRFRRPQRAAESSDGPDEALDVDTVLAVPAVPVKPAGGESGALTTAGLGVVFGGFTAVDDVSITVAPGRIHGLIGPNGAGKTTFVNLLTGLVEPTTGTVHIGDKELRGAPYKRARDGVSRTFQNLRIFPNMTVFDNVSVGAIGREPNRPWSTFAGGRAEAARISAVSEQVLEQVGLAAVAGELAANLSYGKRKMLEIARALAGRPQLLILDEPAAGLNDTETAELAAFIRRLRADGTTVLLVEHDMGLVMSICTRVVVLAFGRKIADDVPEAVKRNPQVIEAYLGTEEDA